MNAPPLARPDVAGVVLDGEAVIHRRGRVHRLDPVATLVWQCCDGQATLDEIGAELAGVFTAPSETVQRDVSAAIDQLATLDLLVPSAPEANPADPGEELELLVDPPGSCASCADRSWARRRTFRVGSHLISVGTDSERADSVLARALAAHEVPTPSALAAEPPFFAIDLHDRGPGGGPQLLDLVHRGDTVVARARRPDQAVRALVTQLASYGEPGRGLAVVNGMVVALGERAMIVAAPHDSVRFRRGLASFGVAVADAAFAFVDPVPGEAVVGAPGLHVDPAPIEALASESVDEPGVLPWGRYRIVGIGVPAPASRSTALLALGPELGDHRDHDATFDALLALLATVPVTDAVDPDAIHAFLSAG